jgi:hypothetical protein
LPFVSTTAAFGGTDGSTLNGTDTAGVVVVAAGVVDGAFGVVAAGVGLAGVVAAVVVVAAAFVEAAGAALGVVDVVVVTFCA